MSKIIKNFKNINYGPAPEDSKDVMRWIQELDRPNKLYINGTWVKSNSNKKLNIINPSNNKKLATLAISNKKDVKLLKKARHRQKMAEAIFRAVSTFKDKYENETYNAN